MDRVWDQIDSPSTDILSWAFGNEGIQSDRPIFIDAYNSTRSIDYGTARQTVRQLVRGLKKCGLKKGDTVCLHSFNDIWYPIIYLAIIGAQGCFVGSNPAYKSLELRHLLDTSAAKFLVIDSRQLKDVLPTASNLGISAQNTFVFDEHTPVSTLSGQKSLLGYGEEDWYIFRASGEDKVTSAVQFLTSGTSGLPKIAVMSHRAIVFQAESAALTVENCPYEIRRLISLPFFHAFAFPFQLLALRRGETTFVMHRFNANDYASFIEKYSITMIPLVPPIALKIFAPSILHRHSFSSLRRIVCAGARLDAETHMMMVRRLHKGVSFSQNWGLSEVPWITAFKCDEIDEPGSVGRLLPGIEAKIVDSNGVEKRNYEEAGEILVKSPGMMLGYAGKSTDTATAKLRDWYATGDIGYCKDGKWYIVDRAKASIKDIIKVRAWQVSPTEIEACINQHPHVQDVAVVGIPTDIETGETPVAFVVAEDGQNDLMALKRGIRAMVEQKLASYKALGQVVFLGQIPRTVSGKILRRVLRENLMAERKGGAEGS